MFFARPVRLSSRVGAIAATVAAVTAAALPALAVSGPDVSSWQHPNGAPISWSKVAANGSSFVYIKATEGSTYTNGYLRSDWSGSGAAGLLHGAYHFARPGASTGVSQAKHFVAAVRAVGSFTAKGTLPPALDLEDSGGLSASRLITWTSNWLSTVKSLTGRTPVIYSYPAFWSSHMAGTHAFRSYPLWGACYCTGPTTFGGAWSTWTFWQYTSTSRVAGISGNSDMNRFNGTLTQLRALANGATATTTSTSTTGVSAPTPAPAPTRQATTLSLAAPTSAPAFTTFPVSGYLRTASGHALAGRSVLLNVRWHGTTQWRTIRTATTSTTGHYTFQVRVPGSIDVQTRFVGTTRYVGSHSRTATVAITGGSRHDD